MEHKWTKKALLLVALLLVGVVLLGLMVQGMPHRTRVTLVMKTDVSTAEFWAVTMKGMRAAAEDFNVELAETGASAETEIDEQISVMKQVIADKPDVIILVSSDYRRMAPVVNEAVAAGIRVVTMDSDVDSDARSCYVGSDNYQIGCALGELLNTFTPYAGKVAILSQSSMSSTGIDRALGAHDTITANERTTLVGVFYCDNDPTLAQSITAELVERYPDLAGIVCTNEVCNLGAADYLAENGLADQVAMVGCDNSKAQIRYLEQGVIRGIVIQRPFNMGYEAVRAAAQAAKGERVPEYEEIPCASITLDNMYESGNEKLLFPFGIGVFDSK